MKNIYRFGLDIGLNEILNSVNPTPGQGSISALEKTFAAGYGPDYCAYATYKGRTAIYLALKSLDLGEGSEVLIPSFVCETVLKAVLRARLKPRLIDINPSTYTIDTKKLGENISPKTKALLAVHTFGQPCDMDAIMDVAKEKNIFVVEDCAQAIGAEYKGKKIGSIGDAAIFSFHIDKMLSSGFGGIVLTNNQRIKENLRKNLSELSRCGFKDDLKVRKRFFEGFFYPRTQKMNPTVGDTPYQPTLSGDEEIIEENFVKEMSPVSANLAATQLTKLNSMIEKRRRNARILEKGISGIDFLETPKVSDNAKHVFLTYTVKVKTKNIKEDRIKIINMLNSRGIEAQNYIWAFALHQIPAYRKVCELGCGDFSGTEEVVDSIINIPVHPLLGERDMTRIVEELSSIKT